MISTVDETSHEDKQRMSDSIYGKRKSGEEGMEEIEEQVRLMAASSTLRVDEGDKSGDHAPVPPPEPPAEPLKPYDKSNANLEKWVGKTYERRNPGICVGIKYTVRALNWTDREQQFWVVQDYPAMECMMDCKQFCAWMVEYKPRPVDKTKEEAAPKPKKTPWNQDGKRQD